MLSSVAMSDDRSKSDVPEELMARFGPENDTYSLETSSDEDIRLLLARPEANAPMTELAADWISADVVELTRDSDRNAVETVTE